MSSGLHKTIYVCLYVFVRLCALRVTRHYLQTLFLISHFIRFLSSAGNRRMKRKERNRRQQLMRAKLKNEKESVCGERRRERCQWLSPQMCDGNQSPWKQHESADRAVALAVAHMRHGLACTSTHTLTSVLPFLRSVLLNEHDGFPPAAPRFH